jgi:S1-C subfamily serine protease
MPYAVAMALPRHGRLARTLVVCLVASLLTTASTGALDPELITPAVLDSVIPAAVQVAVAVDRVFPDGRRRAEILPLGSGTVIAPDGLLLTAAHVVDLPSLRDRLAERAQREGVFDPFHYELDADPVLLLGTDGYSLPQPRYRASLLDQNAGLDLALLQISRDDLGQPYDPARLALPFVPVGNSETLSLGEAIAILSYPAMGGGGVLATRGVVSGFRFDDQLHPQRRTAILTDAAVSDGSSGGAAINVRGDLIGIVLAATYLDCDAPNDSMASACLPSGGSVTKLLPSTMVRDYLAGKGLADRLPSRATGATPVPLATPEERIGIDAASSEPRGQAPSSRDAAG